MTITVAKVWIVYTMMTGHPVPLINSPEFTNKTACDIYLSRAGKAVESLRMYCDEK